MPISADFARILDSERSWFNARAAEMARRAPGFNMETLATFLQSGVDAVVSAVAKAVPERARAVAVAAYDIALILVAQQLVGLEARNRLIERVWIELLPSCALQIAEAPGKVLGALSNAAVYLEQPPNLRGDEWLVFLSQLAGRAETASQLLALGQVLAWRAGAAHLRSSALATASQLPEPLALAAVGAAPGGAWAEVHTRLVADPWWLPGQKEASPLARGKKVGDFSGFGGIFRQPPEVRAHADGFWVKSGERYSLLLADAWGAVLHRASREEYAQPYSPALPRPALAGNRLELARGNVELDLPAGKMDIAWNAHTVAVVSSYSYMIRLFPLS